MLNPQRIHALLVECMIRDDEVGQPSTEVDGIVAEATLHDGRVADATAEIVAMLDQLPNDFKAAPAGGGGWSFLNACMDRDGNQWTGEHRSVEELFMLGLAAGKVRLCLERRLWSSLPGGMPYYVIVP